MINTENALIFPCDFTIKAIGINSINFQEDIINIIQSDFFNAKFICNHSANHKYIAITITMDNVQNQKILDQLYTKLVQHPDSKMVL